MTQQATALLLAFDQLDEDARRDVVMEILRRSTSSSDATLEEELTSSADQIFLALDEAEREL